MSLNQSQMKIEKPEDALGFLGNQENRTEKIKKFRKLLKEAFAEAESDPHTYKFTYNLIKEVAGYQKFESMDIKTLEAFRDFVRDKIVNDFGGYAKAGWKKKAHEEESKKKDEVKKMAAKEEESDEEDDETVEEFIKKIENFSFVSD